MPIQSWKNYALTSRSGTELGLMNPTTFGEDAAAEEEKKKKLRQQQKGYQDTQSPLAGIFSSPAASTLFGVG